MTNRFASRIGETIRELINRAAGPADGAPSYLRHRRNLDPYSIH